MTKNKINEDCLLLLVNKNGLIVTDIIKIEKHFENENAELRKFCMFNEKDNIDQIISFINNSIKPKLPNKVFNYCEKLDEAYQGIIIDPEAKIEQILDEQQRIYKIQEINKDYNLLKNIEKLKNNILEKLELWFKVFDIEIAYEKAKETSNVLAYSHRISGWSNPEYRITDNLTQVIITNFGYGRSSYFYSLITYKNIQITPLSDWIYYIYAHYADVIRYTRRHYTRHGKPVIKNQYWSNAMDFTQTAANISLKSEDEFIEKYIISECEAMVNGLETIYRDNEFKFLNGEIENKDWYTLKLEGFELMDFKTEKILGALNFINKIIEYNDIIPTKKYIPRIKSLCEKFIPNVYIVLKDQQNELKKCKKELKLFLKDEKNLDKKHEYYKRKRLHSEIDFDSKYKLEYEKFEKKYYINQRNLSECDKKIEFHEKNILKFNHLIALYNKHMGN